MTRGAFKLLSAGIKNGKISTKSRITTPIRDGRNPPQLQARQYPVAGFLHVQSQNVGITQGDAMTTNSLSLRSPCEVLAIMPFVLGFHPTNSIVVIV